jgi:hypothetical protein
MKKHYLAIDFCGWATDEDRDKAMMKRAKDTGEIATMYVYEIPLPEKSVYEIIGFQPRVPGAKLITTVNINRLEQEVEFKTAV